MSNVPMSEMSIDILGLSERPYVTLKRAGIETIGAVVSRSEEELLQVVNFGALSLEEVKQKLERFGIAPLKSSPVPE